MPPIRFQYGMGYIRWPMSHESSRLTHYTIIWKAFVCFTWRIRIKETSCIRYSDVTVEQETENWQLIGCQFWLVTRLLLGNIRKSLLPNYLYNSKTASPIPKIQRYSHLPKKMSSSLASYCIITSAIQKWEFFTLRILPKISVSFTATISVTHFESLKKNLKNQKKIWNFWKKKNFFLEIGNDGIWCGIIWSRRDSRQTKRKKRSVQERPLTIIFVQTTWWIFSFHRTFFGFDDEGSPAQGFEKLEMCNQ